MAEHDEPLAYRIPDVARLLGCTEAAARRLIERRLIPSRRLGRRVIVLPDELRAYLKSLHRPGQELASPRPSRGA